jgi:hypothetical protein
VDEQAGDLAQAIVHMSDTQTLGGHHLLRASIAAAGGRFDASFEEAMRAIEIDPIFGGVAGHQAGIAALWMRDVERLRATVERIDSLPPTGRLRDATVVSLRAGVAALEGRHDEAIRGFRDGVRRFRELGAVFHASQVAVSFAMAVGPSDPEVRTAVEEAREVFSRVGARPWLDRIDAVLSGEVQPILAPSSITEEAPIG